MNSDHKTDGKFGFLDVRNGSKMSFNRFLTSVTYKIFASLNSSNFMSDFDLLDRINGYTPVVFSLDKPYSSRMELYDISKKKKFTIVQ